MLASTTNLDNCYQLLGIYRGASLDELKTAYRSLARKWHPDLNPGDINATQRFIALNQAYQTLLAKIPAYSPQFGDRSTTPNRQADTPTVRVTRQPPQPPAPPQQTRNDAELKWQLYAELKPLLKQQQFLKAIVLIEGLAQHSPQDHQICQWQGIVYAQFGYKLIELRELAKARIYLKKALKVDPHNRQLWQEVDRAFNRIAQLT